MPDVGQQKEEKMTPEEMKAKLDEQAEAIKNLSSSKERLESENSKVKARAQEAETKVSDAEKAILAAEGKTQELLDIEKNEKLVLNTQLKEQGSTILNEKLKSKLSQLCPDAHENAIDQMLKVTEHKNLLTLDRENLTVSGVDDFQKALRETHAFYFKGTKLPDTETTPPNGKGLDKPLTDTEQYSKELREAKNQTEYDAVRKKWGRT